MSEKKYDLVVIGGGPGGYVAAIRASQLGLNTALVEYENLGGVCLNWGCIPTKALLKTAEVYRNIKDAEKYGLKVSGVEYDLDKIVGRSRNIAGQLSTGVTGLLKKNKVEVIKGFGRLLGDGRVNVARDQASSFDFSAENIIIASGARARVLSGLEPDGELIWTYKEAMTPDIMPKKLLVVGSGAIGIEFASFYNTLGAEVTVIEVLPHILPTEDIEISELARKLFEKDGIDFITKAKLTSFKKKKETLTAVINIDEKAHELDFDKVIMAVGIQGNHENLGLENTMVKVQKGHIVTDQWNATAETGVYAIGDIVGPPWLAHKASHEGIICVERIAGKKKTHPLDKNKIPGCTYSHPQIASVGLTEAQAIEKGFDIKVGRFPFVGNGKAIALGEPEGLIKTVFDASNGELLGAHMIGTEVTELIQGYSIGMTLETTEAEIIETVFPHPTLSEMMHESVLNAYERAIHY